MWCKRPGRNQHPSFCLASSPLVRDLCHLLVYLHPRADEDLPLVYLDVSIKGKPLGRMEFVLFTNTSPWAAENMRRMCTGV
jgi:hypothetical protein